MTKVKLTWLVLIFSLVSIGEFLLFRSYVLREVSGFYPPNFDQANYLSYVYELYELIQSRGIFKAFHETYLLFTGILFPIQTVVFFLMTGASRFNALLLNFIYFILLQIITLWTLKSLNARNATLAIMLGLILSLQLPFLVGGMFDFRMDFLAFCMMGILICSVIKSHFFKIQSWCYAVAAAAVWLILLRGITLTYVIFIFAVMWLYFFIDFLRTEKDSISYQESRQRIINIFLTGLIILLLIVPIMWSVKTDLYNYYIYNHFVGGEKPFRGLSSDMDWISTLFYYPNIVIMESIGRMGRYSIALVLLFIVYSKLFRHHIRLKEDKGSWKPGLLFLLASIFIPLVILTLDPAKSSVVGGIVVMPCLWLFIWLLLHLEIKDKDLILFNIIAVILLFGGIYNQVHEMKSSSNEKTRQSLMTISAMYKDIGQYADRHHWKTVDFSVDQTLDILSSSCFKVLYYERHHKLYYTTAQKMGATIFPITKQDALDSLRHSNVVILTASEYPKNNLTPFNSSMARLLPVIRQEVKHSFNHLKNYNFKDGSYSVYVR